MTDVLEARIALHNFFDPMWQSGLFSREQLYSEMSELLGREAHVSQMSLDEIKKCASYLVNKTRQEFPCDTCKCCVGKRYNIPVCKKNQERSVNACRFYFSKTDV